MPEETPTDPNRCCGSAIFGDMSFTLTVGTLDSVLGLHPGLFLDDAGISYCSSLRVSAPFSCALRAPCKDVFPRVERSNLPTREIIKDRSSKGGLNTHTFANFLDSLERLCSKNATRRRYLANNHFELDASQLPLCCCCCAASRFGLVLPQQQRELPSFFFLLLLIFFCIFWGLQKEEREDGDIYVCIYYYTM